LKSKEVDMARKTVSAKKTKKSVSARKTKKAVSANCSKRPFVLSRYGRRGIFV
jgi:hypothetical protein